MFLQIKIREDDQVAQRFLWREENEETPPEEYVMQVMLFGAICSPFQAQYFRDRNATRFEKLYPRAVEAVHKAHYLDDYLDCADSDEEAIKIVKDVFLIHKSGGLQMVNWVSNSPVVMITLQGVQKEPDIKLFDANHAEKVLGIRWNPLKDIFTFQLNKTKIPVDVFNGKRRPTKREILRLVMSRFDPLGFLGWFIVAAKIVLQDIWRVKTGWDDEIDEKLYHRWKRWLSQIDYVEKLETPRCYTPLIPSASRLELHIFCDASDRAYAALGYLRVVSQSKIIVSLMAAKCRMAPLKQISVPRLELQAAVVRVRLAKTLRLESGLLFSQEYFWSDSKTVLHWVNNNEVRYEMFVSHRLGEIVESSDPKDWRWVPGTDNPTDDGTKETFVNSDRWFVGPEFLRGIEEAWPICGEGTSSEANTEGCEQLNLVVASEAASGCLPDIDRFSNWQMLIRVTACSIRFVKRYLKVNLKSNTLTPQEIRDAEEAWWKHTQKVDFSLEISDLKSGHYVKKGSKLYRLTPPREYLPTLVTRTKWVGQESKVSVGQLVYLADRTRAQVRPGRSTATYPGRDGNTRVVDVKTSDSLQKTNLQSAPTHH